jgi:hypothetical protein
VVDGAKVPRPPRRTHGIGQNRHSDATRIVGGWLEIRYQAEFSSYIDESGIRRRGRRVVADHISGAGVVDRRIVAARLVEQLVRDKVERFKAIPERERSTSYEIRGLRFAPVSRTRPLEARLPRADNGLRIRVSRQRDLS